MPSLAHSDTLTTASSIITSITLQEWVLLVSGILVIRAILISIYNVFFHPLAKYPGPRLASISDVWVAYHYSSGKWPWVVELAMKQYDIHSAKRDLKDTFIKTPLMDGLGDEDDGILWERNPEKHRAVSKMMSPAFSGNSLRAKIPTLNKHIDLMISQMREHGQQSAGLDVSVWFTWLAMDSATDLACGWELHNLRGQTFPFGAASVSWEYAELLNPGLSYLTEQLLTPENYSELRDMKNHAFLEGMDAASMLAIILSTTKISPILTPAVMLLTPWRLMRSLPQMLKSLRARVVERIEKRNNLKHSDFFEQLLPPAKESPRTSKQIRHMLTVIGQLIIGGYDTTSVTTYMLFYFGLRNPEVLEGLKREIRGSFSRYEDINADSLRNLPWLNACMQETLRVVTVATHHSLPRISPGAMVDATYVPKDVICRTSLFTYNRSERFFHDPSSFRPERWLSPDHPKYDPVFVNDNHRGYMPFILGPRQCPGREVAKITFRLVVAKLFWSFDIEQVSKQLEFDRDFRVYKEFKEITTQPSNSALHSTTSEDSGRISSATMSIQSQTPVSSDESPSPASTKPTSFLEDLPDHPVELLFGEETARSAGNEKQPSVPQAATLTDGVTKSIVGGPTRILHNNFSTESPSQPEVSKQLIQTFTVIDEKVLELSFSQSLLYFSAAFADNPTHLNLTSAFRVIGDLDIKTMKTAVLALGKERESLRTRFFVENSRPMQGVMESSPLHLEHYIAQHESDLATYTDDIHNYVYDRERGHTIRLAVVSMPGGRNFVIMGTHHLAMDGQSALPFMKGLLEHYTRTNQGIPSIQYSDISEKQHANFRLGRLEDELTYWKRELSDLSPALPIMRTSLMISRPLLQGYRNRHVDVKIGLETKKIIQALCRRCRVTPFHFFLAVYRDMMESIGTFVNVLPLVFRTNSQLRFDAILQETRLKAHAALKHSRLPFYLLLRELGIARSATTTPIFQAFIDYRLVGETMSWGEFRFELLSFQRSVMAYDVALDIFDNAGADYGLTFIVRDDLYSQADVERLADSYVCLVNALAREPQMITREAQIFEESKIQNALDLGRVLQEPTTNWVSTILAIWRLGGTYPPLSIGTPWARLAAMAKDAQPQVVLVDEHTRENIPKLELKDARVINVSSGSSGTPKGIVLTHRGIQSWLQPCGLLYNMKAGSEVILQQSSQGFDMSLMQIFTALCFGGSVCLLPRRFSGDARAISETITRHNITHTYGTPSEYLSWLRYGDSQALKQSCWKTALVGGELLTSSVLKGFAALDKDDLRLHHMYGTTESTFCATVIELDYIKTSEEDTGMTASQVSYSAGFALPNYNVYILDGEHQQPLPVGLQGEIYIGGGGVAQGYLNNPSLTTKTFVPDPFATADDHARGWNMMQRTGDLGRWSQTEHGAIIIEGRVHGDTMVKLRGLRVDLRDIETAMLRTSASLLADVVVSVRQTTPGLPEFLAAHIVFRSDLLPKKDEHNSHIQQIRAKLELPTSMKPAFIVVLDSLPRTASGKLDRRAINALPLLDEHINHNEIIRTASEERLKTVWEDVLCGVNTLSINPETDFFHIGGTSLVLLDLRDKIMAEFDVELSLVDMFETSTLSTMAGRIDGRTREPELIDWDKETKLPPSVCGRDISSLQPIPKSLARVIVVTGATGYLGKALLQVLENDPTIKEIHCLAVRNATSRADLKPFTKATAHEGDLSQVRLGLSQALIDDLFGRADIVIHNGADTSYLKTYQSMRQSNYQTTRDLVDWCMPRMVPFHYISTAGIGCYAPGSPLREASMRSTPPPLVGDSTGYTACKWASEVFLENLVKRHPDWPICVHRPTLISRDDIPQLDAVHNILGFARKLGAVASAQGVARGVMNVVTLEAVIAGIMKCVLSHSHGDAGRVHFVNHAGSLELPLSNMRKWVLERTAGGDVRFADVELAEIPLEEWVRRAVEHGMHPTMGVLLTTFARHGEVEFPVVVAEEAGD
ncbi:hypothetical protein EKO27_g8805 [Xylaria grammica]|uniref:Carrier domain-containing protein n=1 Tax=Xylaria grammica TaxID=363999 RepID=A0A439CVY7_9PEZI|nr:hypothetical protein EKO27_g8805 [Xylaria grammica]